MRSLYIHIPFCKKKCFYCSFVVCVHRMDAIERYLSCLNKESNKHEQESVQTIYLGGGTPSSLNEEHFGILMRMLRKKFSLVKKGEFTIECNPEDISEERVRCYFDYGINRISLGIQTFDDHLLRFLGRCHDSRKAYSAFEILKRSGFKNINVDLMYSFPQQTKRQIQADIEKVVQLKPDHISIYSLSIEEGSKFHVQKIKLPNERLQVQQYMFVTELLERNGYQQYEISNFARKGKESKHNIHYWTGGNYIGLGVGAHSHHNGRRAWNVSRLSEYFKRIERGNSPEESFEELRPDQRLAEALVFGLRMNRGINYKELEKRYTCRLSEEKREQMKYFKEKRLLIEKGNIIKTTMKGRLVIDEISMHLV